MLERDSGSLIEEVKHIQKKSQEQTKRSYYFPKKADQDVGISTEIV